MNTILKQLKLGPLLVGEIRGFSPEVGKKFDKSDKNAPPIVFGVLKINIELLENGTAVIVSVYPKQDDNIDDLIVKLGLKRGSVAAFIVGKAEYKEGIRKVSCSPESIWVLDPEEEGRLRAA